MPPDKAADLRVKHLEMVQSIVARMAANSATVKNYCITLTTAVCGFAVMIHRPLIAALALLPIASFALLDAQYLRLERRFRGLFDRVRSEDWGTIPTLEINLKATPPQPYWATFISWSIFSFYSPLAVGVAIVVVATRGLHGISP
jgi:hypothetical protein